MCSPKSLARANSARSPSWNLTQAFDSGPEDVSFDDVKRGWDKAVESCQIMLRLRELNTAAEEDAYMLFLEEREAMAKGMLAKIACARLKWGAEVDKSTLRVMEAYVADNLGEFSEEDIEITNLSAASRGQKERGSGGGGVGSGAGASAGADADAGAGDGATDGDVDGAGDGDGDGTGDGDGAGGGGGDGDVAGAGAGGGGGDGTGDGDGADDETGERIVKKPRKSKVATMQLLPEELSEQIKSMNMLGYESVEDRFRCVWVHVSSVEGKLSANDLAKALHGYFYKPLHKSVSEEQALARLIVGYRMVNMEQLDRAFADVKSSYTYGPSWVKSEFMVINNLELEKERIQESEKLLIECGMKQGSVDLLEGIFLTMAALRLAIDWKSIGETPEGRKWKRATNDALFQFQCHGQLDEFQVLTRRRQEVALRRKWAKDNERLVTRRNKVLGLFKKFGCVILLDPIWSPMVTRTPDFNKLHGCILDNMLTRARRVDDDVEGDDNVPWHTGNDMENRKMLVELVRYFTTDDIANFVDDTVERLEQDAAEVVA
ncbi:hypothetical protein PTI98_009364 [Pleurotus ostreatus]|nr:hypothetical protein PTI98_009364 [Pleurotus ostreatus]